MSEVQLGKGEGEKEGKAKAKAKEGSIIQDRRFGLGHESFTVYLFSKL